MIYFPPPVEVKENVLNVWEDQLAEELATPKKVDTFVKEFVNEFV